MHPSYEDLLNNLHYFYSTLPQVLGAILAITGAFVVFKIDSLKKALWGKVERFLDKYTGSLTNNIETEFDKAIHKNKSDKIIKDGIDHKTMLQYFRSETKNIKYAKISGDVGAINRIFKDKQDKIIEEFKVLKLETQKIEGKWYLENYTELIRQCNTILSSIQEIEIFASRTKQVYIINGVILGVLIGSFVLLPRIPLPGKLYYLAFSFGFLLTIISLWNIIKYLIISLGVKGRNDSSSGSKKK